MSAGGRGEKRSARLRYPLGLILAFTLLGLVAGLLVVGVARWNRASLRRDQQLAEAAVHLRSALLQQHLALEELLAGDESAGPSGERARKEIAYQLSRLAGGIQEQERDAGTLRGWIDQVEAGYRDLEAENLDRRSRKERGEPVGPGTAADLAYDRAAERAVAAVDALEAELGAHANRQGRRAWQWTSAALAIWGVVVAGVAALVVAWDRRQRQAEAALRESERRLLQAQKMEAVGRLAGGVAHDVNNYLATIRTHCELVAARELPRERVVEKMELITATVLKASSLIERLLTFARRQPTRPEVVSLNEVVGDFERMMQGSLPQGVELVLGLDPSAPAVEVDLGALEQVLVNLVVNARDALAGRGEIRLETALGAGKSGRSEVRLTVRDTGRGIPPEQLSQIFEPFFTTRAGVGASGLGLATVATIVEQAGGRVEVESQVGQGSSFHVFLPAAAGRKKGRSRPAAASVAVKGERILLVDDNRDLAAAVLSHLSELGYRVRSVDSAEAALAAASEASEPFDLVVTDVLLRGAPGTELVDRLRSVHPIRALYMSGYTDRIALRRDSTHAEAFFLKKPFSVEGLARMVRELLDAPAAGSTAAEAGPGMDTMAP